ncbi:MAG TPA: hypothetical protein VGZ29_03325 [Terriglobia bacterium]|nr:hypothetical protein [Terriglobia bacterium]
MGYRKGRDILLFLLMSSLPLFADRGSSAYKHGVRAESQGNFDSAYGDYSDAHRWDPKNAKYFAAYMRMRDKAAAEHLHHGQVLRNTGALNDAAVEFQHAVELDPSSFVAQQELRRTAEMIRERERQRPTTTAESPLDRLAADVGGSVELRPVSNAPVTVHLAASVDQIYRTICNLAGINVLIDPDYKPQKVSVDLNDVSLLQALDMVSLQSKTFWRPVLPNTIFVAADSPTKRKEHEENVMKTFYLQNVSSPNDLQEAASVVGKMLDVNRVQLLQAQDALVVRGTIDQMALVERLLANIDKPKPEVVIDVAVMEVSRERVRTLGANLPTTASISSTAALANGSAGTGSSGVSSGGNSSGGYTQTFGSFAISIPGGSFTALASDSNSKILQNPEIRVINDEKATLKIGDRVPIATGSFASGLVGGGSISPLVSTQFTYLDVGVNIDITPHIHANREVTLKMVLEISSVTGEESIGGITQPVIGQRRIEHETELADGEVNLLGGILEDTETQSLSGYPWISKVPLLKYLFAQENKQRQENEIVFAITPHIVRASEITEDNLTVLDVGTGNSTQLRRKSHAVAGSGNDHPVEGKPNSSSAPTGPAVIPSPASAVPATAPRSTAQGKAEVRPGQ